MARILYMSQGYTTHDHRFLSEIAGSGHQAWLLPFEIHPIVYESRPVPSRVTRLAPLVDRHFLGGPFRWAKALYRLKQHIRSIQPHIIHAGPVQTSAFLAALVRFHPLLVMSWGSDVLTTGVRNWYLRQITHFTLTRSDMFFADCEAVKNKVLTMVPLRSDQFVLFPWGVDTSVFYPRSSQLGARERFGWDNCRILLYTRGFEPIHSPRVFLDALRRVVQQRKEVRAIMLGDGSLRREMEDYITENGLKEHVRLIGQVQHSAVPEYFNEADLYVSTTLSDGSSISLLEAMACGLTGIVTNGEGNREWIVPGQNGWLYPAGNAQALAEGILAALHNDSHRIAMGTANVKVIQDRADWKINFNKLLRAYDTLLVASTSQRHTEVPVPGI